MARWDDYRFALALGWFGTTADAAEWLGTDPTTVIRRITRLSDDLGIEIFRRGGGWRYHVTAEGVSVVRAAERMLNQIAEFEDGNLEDFAFMGRVRVVVPDDLFGAVLAPYFARLATEYPLIKLELELDRRNRGIHDGDVDLAVQLVPTEEEQPLLDTWRVGPVAWSVYGHPSYFRGKPPLNAVRDLGRHNVVGPFDRPHFRAWAESVACQFYSSLHTNSLLTYSGYAASGEFLAVLPCYLGEATAGLRRVLPRIRALQHELRIQAHPEVLEIRRVRAVGEWLADLSQGDRSRLSAQPPAPPPRLRTRRRSSARRSGS